MCFFERMSGFILDLSRLWALFSRVKQPRPVHAPGNRAPHLFEFPMVTVTYMKKLCIIGAIALKLPAMIIAIL